MLRSLAMIVDEGDITGIVNVGDDLVLHGLKICPDLDTITYTLAGLDNTETGWGLAGETWRVMAELGALGGENWFSLGDRDLATHLYRTERLRSGATLTEVAAELARHHGVGVRLLPSSLDEVATRFSTPEGTSLSFQEYFVKHHHAVVVDGISFLGAETARPGPGVIEAIEEAERLVICPSNPLISIDPILAIPGIREALVRRRDDVVAVSPLIGGKALKGPADRLMAELGHDVSNKGIAALYAPVASTLLIDFSDGEDAADVIDEGIDCFVTNTVMDTPERSQAVALAVLSA
jgi:LPPG:FO 2-phospho-L-lactate transferase